MKNTKSNYGQSSQTNRHFNRALALGALALALAGGGCTHTEPVISRRRRFAEYINGQPFSVQAPKDSNLAGFDAVAETNGAIHVHIDSLQSSLNPTNLANAGVAQAAIITATAQAINQALQTATATAIKAAAP